MSARLVSPTVVNHFFYNALALNALPVHLLRQVYFFLFLGSLFCVRFLFVFLEALEGPLEVIGSILGHLGSIFVSFWSLFQGRVGL